MTQFGKSLVVFAVGASFAFLGFAWVSMIGGPNWEAEAAALPGYSIQKEGDRWSATNRVSGATVTVEAPSVQASAIIAARKDLQKKQQDEVAALRTETDAYKQKLVEVRKVNAADVKALDARIEDLRRQLEELNNRLLKLSNDVVKQSQEAQAIRTEAAKRREDVFRLTRELQEIRADNFRADDLQTKLNDQLVRLQGVEAALESRNKQLREQVGTGG